MAEKSIFLPFQQNLMAKRAVKTRPQARGVTMQDRCEGAGFRQCLWPPFGFIARLVITCAGVATALCRRACGS